jgi:integrase
MVQAALLTGCRYSELARLKCANFNSDSGTLAIRLSKGKIRHVVLTDEGKACFADWTKVRAPSENVFLRADATPEAPRTRSGRWMRRASGHKFPQR